MFENFLVRPDSLENVRNESGDIVGFRFAVRIADYRGCFLSLHNGYYIEMDGIEYPREKQKFGINGRRPRNFDEIRTCTWEFWNYDDEGLVYVEKHGGLKEGEHTLLLQQSVLSQYGYMPWDEEWVKNPPVPGGGAGSGKSPFICRYVLVLQEDGSHGN